MDAQDAVNTDMHHCIPVIVALPGFWLGFRVERTPLSLTLGRGPCTPLNGPMTCYMNPRLGSMNTD